MHPPLPNNKVTLLQASKIEKKKNSKRKNILEIPKILNSRIIKMVDAIELQFSRFIYHVDTNKWWNL